MRRTDRQRMPRKTLESKTYGSRPTEKPKKRWTDAMTRHARKLLGTAGWK